MANGTNIGTGYLQIVPSAEGIQGKVTQMLRGEAESAGDSAGSTIGSKIVKAIAAAGIGQAIKTAVSAGADIEQSWGGIQTMFKSNAGQMAKYAKDAYKTAGISANAYMENVTSFSAALIQGLNGNTKKAAKAADTAMRDMSDNANKFGTDIGAIQNAYQGFAKNNYTMLDNLKLGYGGTASEMARLINDTGVMGEKFKATSKNVNEVPFNKIVEAIHKTQKEMGVTGTTAKEASETISGSFGMVQASVTDFMGALSMSGSEGMEDFKLSVYDTFMNMVSSVATYGVNFASAVGRVFENLATLIAEKGPEMATQGMEIITNLSQGLIDGIPDFISHALDLLETFADNLTANLPQMLEMGKDILSNMITGLTNAIPEFVSRAPEIISKFANLINDNAPTLLKYGFDLVVQLGQGLLSAIPVIVANLPQIFTAITDVWQAINWINLGQQAIRLIGNGITAIGTTLPNVVRNVGSKAVNAFKSVNWNATGKAAITLLKNAVSSVGSLIVNALKSIGTKATSGFKSISWSSVGKAVINLLKVAITGAGGMIVSALKSVGTKALSSFKGINWKSLGTNIINGIKSGVTGAASGLYNSLKDVATNALKSAKKFLGIHSPSRVFADQIGSMIPSGIALGISANASSLTDAIDAISNEAIVKASGIVNFDTSRTRTDAYSKSPVQDDNSVESILAVYLPLILDEMNNMQVVLDDGTVAGRVEKRLINVQNRRRLAWK